MDIEQTFENPQDAYSMHLYDAATHCNTLQYTATHFRDTTLYVTVTHCKCNTLQHTAIHRSTLQHTAIHRSTLQHTAIHCNTPQHTATHCNTPRNTATHCNTLQYTAAHCNTLPHFLETHPQCYISVRHVAERVQGGEDP